MIRPTLGNVIFIGFGALAFMLAFSALSRWASATNLPVVSGLGKAGVAVLHLTEAA